MRIFRFAGLPLALVAMLAVVSLLGLYPLRADEPKDPVKVNSVWQGRCEQPDQGPYPMILFVKQRKGEDFEGVTWYPSLENGLVKVTGKVDAKGTVTFTEEKVIHGEATNERPGGALSGSKFTARLEKTTLKGTGEYSGPEFKGVVQMKFSLKLAE